ncbi:deoxyribose-phosphate aldolase [Clostridium punense]|uniref:Deoxyribose-phosphate aldolase n=1 Tax=Clostridium punense TaxID=1054297 RepID=A0ABS4K7R4_9CLOT|nr:MULTISPECIES: deoxyribose-phosphate aldolase [Clostridium]EQB85730.1 deoxyribose-phosphate aldolase [Clostridium sp. BL8]MBP2023831.1 deoxyribose-phosphate aldolase [Clostridium punense]
MNIASMIDHTLLKPDASRDAVIKICAEAREYKFKSVCVNSCHTKLVAEELKDSGVLVCTVIGFPLGAMETKSKAFETARAIELGANEIDMVINVGALKDKDYDLVLNDIKEVVETAKGKAIVKVILETCLLTNEEKIKACQLSQEAGADFVKTSTGFSTGGATVEDIKLMRETVGPNMGVKASGAVRTKEDALAVIEAGANRIGASSSIAIVEGLVDSNSGY